MLSKPKLRIFAGPNGSGKTTLYESIQSTYFSTRLFVNADKIEAAFNQSHYLNFTDYSIQVDNAEFQQFCEQSGLYVKADFNNNTWNLTVKGNILVSTTSYNLTLYNSYHFAIIADYIREKLIQDRQSFSFETVFSHPGKLEQIVRAKQKGFKIYLYFIGTETPSMNIERVKDRILKGGHPVSPDKISSRYYLVMDLLIQILQKSDEAYLWDNSKERHEFVASYKKGTILFEKSTVPEWVYTYIIDKVGH